ncbi:MAG: hypothetical protein V1822_00505 [Candidatus Micrarchaeota archaeon]
MNIRLFIVLTAVAALALPALALYDQKYSWKDGTTAPIECVEKCRESGVQVEAGALGDTHYLSEACRTICFGNMVAHASANSGSAAQAGVGEKAGKQNTGTNVQDGAGNPGDTADKNTDGTIGSANAPNVAAEPAGTDIGQASEIGQANGAQPAMDTGEEQDGSGSAIGQYISSNARIRISDIAKGKAVDVTPAQITVGSTKVNSGQKTLEAFVQGRQINIIQKQGMVSIEDGQASASAAAVSITPKGSLEVEGQEVAVLPSLIYSQIKGEVENLSLARMNGQIVYQARAKRSAKFVGIFGVEYEVDSQYSAQTGELIGSNKPIWTLLAFE